MAARRICQPRNGIKEQYDDLEAMRATVRLNDILDTLEMQFDESSSFVDRDYRPSGNSLSHSSA